VALIAAVAAIVAALIPIVCNKPAIIPSEPHPLATCHYSFSGMVVDNGSHRSIPGAEITIVGKDRHYFSEGDGNFHLSLDTNDIRVRVTKDGYEPFDESYSLPQDASIIPLTKTK